MNAVGGKRDSPGCFFERHVTKEKRIGIAPLRLSPFVESISRPSPLVGEGRVSGFIEHGKNVNRFGARLWV